MSTASIVPAKAYRPALRNFPVVLRFNEAAKIRNIAALTRSQLVLFLDEETVLLFLCFALRWRHALVPFLLPPVSAAIGSNVGTAGVEEWFTRPPSQSWTSTILGLSFSMDPWLDTKCLKARHIIDHLFFFTEYCKFSQKLMHAIGMKFYTLITAKWRQANLKQGQCCMVHPEDWMYRISIRTGPQPLGT